ncbi:uncharacterized protein LTR77_007559 [Saxophila tyrrhenica]|uniref:Tryptophan synthase beta chain-like PALP domain-containing protein n=1 Tax=Saxophila tyrrhenica TaxID=1690608 RepID=A0AAV9P2X0_9PEZI|nr:hypothetical protein LTR77_007559 [Saxophila tyrrhenica]
MQNYKVTHLSPGQTFTRPAVLVNPLLNKEREWPFRDLSHVEAFHKTLPDYNQTRLHSLPSLAAELGIGNVFLKDESNRFGLPAFKVLGASWAVHKAVCQKIDIDPENTSVTEATDILERDGTKIELITCTAGNWGRAVARIAHYLRVKARVYVPGYTSESTKDAISNEGAELVVDSGSTYDEALTSAQRDAEASGALLVQDVSWEGYEDIPAWACQGYDTMLQEADRQASDATGGKKPNVVIASVGGGLWAQAVVAHYKGVDTSNIIVTAEADTATGFKESLHCGENTGVQSGVTIMEGMNSGLTIESVWPTLRDGTDVAVAVTDREAHESVEFLQGQGINAGPCGGATLAALRKAVEAEAVGERGQMVVVLFSTEGGREYEELED